MNILLIILGVIFISWIILFLIFLLFGEGMGEKSIVYFAFSYTYCSITSKLFAVIAIIVGTWFFSTHKINIQVNSDNPIKPTNSIISTNSIK